MEVELDSFAKHPARTHIIQDTFYRQKLLILPCRGCGSTLLAFP